MMHEKAERYDKPSSILERIAPRKASHAPSMGKKGVMAKTKDWETFREQLLKNGAEQQKAGVERLKAGAERLRGAIRVQGKENTAFQARLQGKTRELQNQMSEVQVKTKTYTRDFYYG